MKKVILCLLLSMMGVVSCAGIGLAEKDQFMYGDWLKIVEISEQMQTRPDLIEQINRIFINLSGIIEDLGDLQAIHGEECKNSSEFRDLFYEFVKGYLEVQRLEEEMYNLSEKRQIKDVLLKYTNLTI